MPNAGEFPTPEARNAHFALIETRAKKSMATIEAAARPPVDTAVAAHSWEHSRVLAGFVGSTAFVVMSKLALGRSVSKIAHDLNMSRQRVYRLVEYTRQLMQIKTRGEVIAYWRTAMTVIMR